MSVNPCTSAAVATAGTIGQHGKLVDAFVNAIDKMSYEEAWANYYGGGHYRIFAAKTKDGKYLSYTGYYTNEKSRHYLEPIQYYDSSNATRYELSYSEINAIEDALKHKFG